MYPSTTPHLWCINRIAHGNWNVNLRGCRVLIICWLYLTRKLTVMTRGLMISPDGAPTNAQKRNLSKKAAERDRGRTPKRLSGRLRDRSALDFSVSFVCGAGVCLSRRAKRADLYKTSTRHGAKVVIFQKRECSCALPKILFIMLP